MSRVWLSTSDNPYNPFTQYMLWNSWDTKVCNYGTESYWARIVASSPELSPEDLSQADEDAIREIVEMDLPLVSPITGERVHYVMLREEDDAASA